MVNVHPSLLPRYREKERSIESSLFAELAIYIGVHIEIDSEGGVRCTRICVSLLGNNLFPPLSPSFHICFYNCFPFLWKISRSSTNSARHFAWGQWNGCIYHRAFWKQVWSWAYLKTSSCSHTRRSKERVYIYIYIYICVCVCVLSYTVWYFYMNQLPCVYSSILQDSVTFQTLSQRLAGIGAALLLEVLRDLPGARNAAVSQV